MMRNAFVVLDCFYDWSLLIGSCDSFNALQAVFSTSYRPCRSNLWSEITIALQRGKAPRVQGPLTVRAEYNSSSSTDCIACVAMVYDWME
jgi:hypothetical protein